MQSTDWMIIFMTFITGVAAGSFIYFKGFAEIDFDPKPAVTPYTQVADFEITVSQYGGCARGASICPSYKLTDEGSYVFIDNAGRSTTGVVTAKQLADIKAAAADFNFAAQSKPVVVTDCFSYIDGTDMSYRVEIDGEQYELDTCGTAVDVDDEFIELLDELLESLFEMQTN